VTQVEENMEKINCDVLISGGTIVTQNSTREIIQNGSIIIKGSEIIDIGKRDDLDFKYSARKLINARGKYIFPGLINTHTHLFQTFIKGLGECLPLYQWVDGIAAPSASAMSERQAYLSTILGGMEAIQCGTTTLLDFMYSMPDSRLHRQVGNGLRDIGLRGVLGLGLMENGEEHGLSPCQFRPVIEALDEWQKIMEEYKGGNLSFALAPEIPFGITPNGYREIRDFATTNGIPITIHINETLDDDRANLKDYQKRAVPFLEELGFWGKDVIGVHCVKMQPEDIEIFVKNNVKISHNPVSNMYLGVGIAPIMELKQSGLTICLGTDGAGSNNSQDMFEVMKSTGLLHKVFHENPAVMNSQTILDMATLGGAKALGQDDRIGSLEVNKQADLFIFDPLKPKSAPVFDPISSLVFSSGSENVSTTIVAGNILMEERKIIGIDELEILQECQKSAWELAERVGYIPKFFTP
jgi:5-methylthioadenosine/S-adenosylhomocysteine deaminase